MEKNKKVLCLYFNNTLFILLDFFLNELYFKYTFEFERNKLFRKSLQIYF